MGGLPGQSRHPPPQPIVNQPSIHFRERRTSVVAQALSDIRVLDLARVLAGPWCTQNLADLGADVIKVERPGIGDDTRGWGPPWLKRPDGSDATDSTYYASANRGKKSLTADISKPAGQVLIKDTGCGFRRVY
jgi:crotonobetainyl-CoA:carnitine CoA-transferase CaiB-like acyl-CoA transferase